MLGEVSWDTVWSTQCKWIIGIQRFWIILSPEINFSPPVLSPQDEFSIKTLFLMSGLVTLQHRKSLPKNNSQANPNIKSSWSNWQSSSVFVCVNEPMANYLYDNLCCSTMVNACPSWGIRNSKFFRIQCKVGPLTKQNNRKQTKQNKQKHTKSCRVLLKSHQEPLTLKGIKICQTIAISHSESTKVVGLETIVFSILPLLTLPSYFLRGRCLEFKVNDMNNKVTFPQRLTL